LPDGIKAGTYKMKIENNYNPNIFDGEKSFVIATTNSVGGKNSAMATAFILLGVVSILSTGGLYIGLKKKSEKNN
jgi:hypothetical protein